MYQITTHEPMLSDESTHSSDSYQYGRAVFVIHDRPTLDESIRELHLRQAKRLFDDMWHTFIPLRRELTTKEYKEYKELFAYVLDLHQKIHRKDEEDI